MTKNILNKNGKSLQREKMTIKNLGQECGFWFQVNLETNPPILVVSDPKTQKQEYIFGKLNKYQEIYFDLKKFIKRQRIKIDKDGSVYWYKNGELHREDGPAVVWPNGTKYWYKNGKSHREDEPARIWANGTKEWYKNGFFHREAGPARIWANGYKEWYKNGKLHREDGPAVVRPDDTKQWWLNDKKYSEQDWKNFVKNKTKCRLRT